jgi:acyl-coenzyme A thioesterase PaaI-like protein
MSGAKHAVTFLAGDSSSEERSHGGAVMEPESFHPNCFACGKENIEGLRLQFTTSGSTNTGTAMIEKRFQGYDGVAQGGIVATILDAVMVRLLHDLFGGNPVTGRLEIRYLRSTPVESPVAVSAFIKGHRGNTCWAEAEIIHDNTLCATARGVFRIVPAEGPLKKGG